MSDIKIATWNVNSVRARLTSVLEWLKTAQPDVALLQELKCQDEAFPYAEIEELGYNCAVHGQKTYNGVAILSKYPLEDIIKGIPNFKLEEWKGEARYIEAVVSLKGEAIRVASVYVPNGGEVESNKWQYKLDFLDNLREHIKTLLPYQEKMVIGGDYNVAPTPLDVYDHKALFGTTCYHPEEQKYLRSIINEGVLDAFRLTNPNKASFSWWDYRGGSWNYNKGMRIDHLLISPQAADCLTSCETDTEPRGHEKPSDHAPVVGVFKTQ